MPLLTHHAPLDYQLPITHTTIAVAGMDIITSVKLDRRALVIVAVSLVLGLGVVYVPEIFDDKPALVKNIFSSATSTGGLTALLLNWLLPRVSTQE